jgi:hypothetical protein
MQSGVITPLSDYFQKELDAHSKNREHFSTELEMAEELFQAAQLVFTNFPTSDTPFRRAQAALLTACIRYFASAIGLCLRGNGVEAESLMRTPIECMGYLIRLTEEPGLVMKWIDIDELKSAHERNKVFGSETSHRKHKYLKKTAETYETFSIFGVHARVQMTDQTMASLPTGWSVAHAETNAHHVRLALVGILFTMRDLINEAMVPLLLEPPHPPGIQTHLERFEDLRSTLGKRHPEFARWTTDARVVHHHDGIIRPAVLVQVKRARKPARKRR